MQIEAFLCGKLVENYVFWPNFSGKLGQKAVEKCVQNTWKQNVQKMNWWKKSQLKTIANVKKQSFTLMANYTIPRPNKGGFAHFPQSLLILLLNIYK